MREIVALKNPSVAQVRTVLKRNRLEESRLSDYEVRFLLDSIISMENVKVKNKVKIGSIEEGLGEVADNYGFDDVGEGGYGKCETAATEMVTYLKKKETTWFFNYINLVT